MLTANAADHISLAGTWRFELDRADAGLQESWAARTLPGKVQVPVDLAAQGIGDRPSLDTKWVGGVQNPGWYKDPVLASYSTPENFKFPYWLTPEHRYMGAAWYQRTLELPKAWAGKRIVLFLERPHWETRVWVDDKLIGTNTALATPHEYDLGALSPGQHTLTIRVDNRIIIDVGENSHSVSDHTQGNWHGFVGRVELRATPLVWIEDLQVYPDLASGGFRLKGKLGNATGKAGAGTVKLGAFAHKTKAVFEPGDAIEVSWTARGGEFQTLVKPERPAQIWDEFNPRLYRVVAALGEHELAITTGLREVQARGTRLHLNGKPIYLRGTLECAIFPKTGHPPTDIASWQKVFTAARTYGLNHLRFHSWCPPEAAFVAADEMGFYLQVECSSWANQSTTIGDGKPVDQWIYEEAERILKYYGNHPSFVLMLYGNEPGGRNHKAFLAKWVEHYKTQDPRRLYSAGSGWPQLPQNEFHVTPDPRVQAWGEGLKSRINSRPPETTTDYRDYISARDVPVISHEIGQWCVYPNFREIPKYTGYLKARNFEIFRDTLKASGMGRLSRQFFMASGKLQALCYKEDIESALRTPGMGGFQLLDLHDFPGQGTALVGVLDPFWEDKGYITGEQYSRFSGPVVPLARMEKRVFTTDETFRASLEVANFGPGAISNAVLTWRITASNGKVWERGTLPLASLPIGNGVSLGNIQADLRKVVAPAQAKLVVGIQGTRYENDWDIWVYPRSGLRDADNPTEVLIVDELSDDAVRRLQDGGKVLLNVQPARLKGDALGRVGLGFSSIFWNTAWTGRQPPHTLGILCNPKHPLFEGFPTEYHSNWQWWYLIHKAGAMILDGMPSELKPTVRVIDDWVTNRRLGMLFEAKVGKGRLVVCSIDLNDDITNDPVRTQFRRSLLSYMQSRKFRPEASLTMEQVRSLFAEPSPMEKLGARVIYSDNSEAGFEPEKVLDGDLSTFWHTRFRDMQPGYPHEIQIQFRNVVSIHGISVAGRQDSNPNGGIKDFSIHVSRDGKEWQLATKGALRLGSGVEQVTFPRAMQAAYLRFVAESSHNQAPFAAIAEIGVDLASP